MRSRKKNQENVPKSLKTTSNTKPKKARKATVSKLSKSCVKGPEKDENTAPNSVLRTPDCFGFNDSDLYDDAPVCKTELTEFDCNKPFRLALYVRPSKRLRINASVIEKIQKLNPTLNLTNMTMNSTLARPLSETAMSPDRTQFKVPFASTPIEKPKKKMLQMKITDSFASPKRTRSGNNDQVFKSYFENSETSDEEVSRIPLCQVSRVLLVIFFSLQLLQQRLQRRGQKIMYPLCPRGNLKLATKAKRCQSRIKGYDINRD